MTVRLRRVGQTNLLDLPSQIKPMYSEFTVYQGRDGQIVYTPVQSNPFLDAKFIATHDFTQDDIFPDTHH
ncbi:antitoxin of toxin-antitoxin stability system [Lactiplantibacillus pingfangensis]|uniref:antitoxin of toxin-antitoxin stability system n=1 Tax=Lactiplantibacillus pingfangensis TaxID=2559915 RepID=UPI0010F48291|nr:antitoxin of toxin-antitoxin stability system [Lactiplantibacillus pingfangensis]